MEKKLLCCVNDMDNRKTGQETFSRKPSWNYRDILADVHWPLNDTKNI